MDLHELFADHIRTISDSTAKAMAVAGYDSVVFHAGSEIDYHDDDQPMPFRSVFHFARFAPVLGPDHLLHFEPGKKPRLLRVVPVDYWYEEPAAPDHPYSELLDVSIVGSLEEAIEAIASPARCVYVGNDLEVAEELGLAEEAVEPEALLARLDWDRGLKTPYEVECIRRSLKLAAQGHAVVREMLPSGASERQLHAAYLSAVGLLENEVPYPNIIGWDEHAAILHYQSKDTSGPRGGRTLLIDAGADCYGYASDITRTYATATAHPVFNQLLDGMETLQLELCDGVEPGKSYVELHDRAHRGVAKLLSESGVLKTDADTAYEQALTRPFFPHGLGHHLGLQVHDVGGRQASPEGGTVDPPDHHPFLRTTREMAAGQVLTIEPGLYFIPMLLDPQRESEHAQAFDWGLIDQLVPCGGIRIEDDVLCTADGQENLSRPFIPGHGG